MTGRRRLVRSTGILADQKAEREALAEALAAALVREPMLLADAVCSIRHPDDRMSFTGFAAPDGNFYVSCATCKGDSYKVADRLADALGDAILASDWLPAYADVVRAEVVAPIQRTITLTENRVLAKHHPNEVLAQLLVDLRAAFVPTAVAALYGNVWDDAHESMCEDGEHCRIHANPYHADTLDTGDDR